jgi:hypothetical protein
MKCSISHSAVAGLLLLAGFSACGVDDRSLSYEYRALGSAGWGGAAGSNPAHAGDAGDPDVDASTAGAGDSTPGGTRGEGGSAANAGGGAATAGAGGTAAGGTAAAGTATGGTTIGGGSGNGGSSASSGAPNGGAGGSGNASGAGGAFDGPCGDLNQDAVDDCSQTLVQNSRFDSGVSAWESEPSSNQTWSASNASSKPGSGSLMLSNTAAVVQQVGSRALGSHQCVPATPDTNYDFDARVSLAAGQAGGSGGIVVWLFDDGACQGNLVGGAAPISGGVAGQWSTLSGRLWVPGGVHSMSVRLVAVKPFVQPELTVLIDDVLVAKR